MFLSGLNIYPSTVNQLLFLFVSLGKTLLLPSAFVDEKTKTNSHCLWTQSSKSLSETIYNHIFLCVYTCFKSSLQDACFFFLFFHVLRWFFSFLRSLKQLPVQLIICWETWRFPEATDTDSTETLLVVSLNSADSRASCLRPDSQTANSAANKHKWLSLFLIVLMRCCKGAMYRVARVNWAVIAESGNASMWVDQQHSDSNV